MEKLSRIIQVGTKYNHMYLFKMEAEGHITHRREAGNVNAEQTGFRTCWSDAATDQGVQAATRSPMRQGQILH